MAVTTISLQEWYKHLRCINKN